MFINIFNNNMKSLFKKNITSLFSKSAQHDIADSHTIEDDGFEILPIDDNLCESGFE